MDAADRAQIEIERAEEQRMQKRRASDARPLVSAQRCVDCTTQISAERRAACPGCQRCADCARGYERRLAR